MNSKETYTKIFLKQADIAISETSLKQYMPLWWQNTRGKESGGLRLTDDGFDFLVEKIDLQMYEILSKRFTNNSNSNILTDLLTVHTTFPRSIYVTDEKKSWNYIFRRSGNMD